MSLYVQMKHSSSDRKVIRNSILFGSVSSGPLNMGGNSFSPNTDGFDFRDIFKNECKEHQHYFSERDDVRQRLYLLLSNCKDLPQKCSRLVEQFMSYTEKTIIPMGKTSMDLTSILMSKAEGITFIQDVYEYKELTPVSLKKLCPPLFAELILEANFSTKTNIKSKVTANAYVEVKNQAIGCQHIMYTTQPGSISDSSSSADLLDDEDSGSNSTAKKRKTCQKAGDFKLLQHEFNSHFSNQVKCQVEIFILVGNAAYCETLAKHMGLILFESLLEGEEKIERRLGSGENKIYRLAHTGIIKKMMNGYSSICITTSTSAWQHTPAHVKGIIYTKDDENVLQLFLKQANYSVFVESQILAYVEAIGKIVQKSLLCNVLMEAKYQVAEKAFTKVHLPMTVIMPLYIVRYFSQSYLAAYEYSSNTNPVDIFVLPDYLHKEV